MTAASETPSNPTNRMDDMFYSISALSVSLSWYKRRKGSSYQVYVVVLFFCYMRPRKDVEMTATVVAASSKAMVPDNANAQTVHHRRLDRLRPVLLLYCTCRVAFPFATVVAFCLPFVIND